jgi:hypothetical protein
MEYWWNETPGENRNMCRITSPIDNLSTTFLTRTDRDETQTSAIKPRTPRRNPDLRVESPVTNFLRNDTEQQGPTRKLSRTAIFGVVIISTRGVITQKGEVLIYFEI